MFVTPRVRQSLAFPCPGFHYAKQNQKPASAPQGLGDLRLTGLADYRMVSAKDDSKSQVPARASSVQGPSG